MGTGPAAKTWGLGRMPDQRDLPRAEKHQAPGVIRYAVETRDGLSHNWFVAATQTVSALNNANQKPRVPLAMQLDSASVCLFRCVLTGGIFVGQTICDALSMLQAIAPVQVDLFVELLEQIRLLSQPSYPLCDSLN